MAQINDAKKATLANLGYTGPIDEAYHNYLAAETGSDLDATQDLEKLLFTTLGYTGSLYDMWFEFLRDNGFTNSLQDMLYAFWNSDDAGLSPLHFSEFYSPLTHSAVPERAAAGTTSTFTRATTSTWKNNDGYLVTGVAGEAGFVGARRVRNLIRTDFSSENMTLNNITSFPVAITPNDITPPAGYSRADRQTSTTPASRSGALTGSTAQVTAGSKVIAQCVAKAGSGRYLCFGDQSDSNWHVMTLDTQTGNVTSGFSGSTGTGSAVELGDGWWELTLKFTKDVTGVVDLLCCHADVASNGAYPFIGAGEYWWATGFQIEDVTAQTTQTAGEYVSVGVESAPYYHGSMVDGVKCFATDLSGNPIPSATLLGYQAQGARTNLCLQSNAFTTTWVNDGLIPVQNSIGPDGGTTAWTLDDNAAGAVERIYQTGITLTAATYMMSVFIKKTSTVPGANSYPLIYATQGANIALATIDPVNGTATVWTTYAGPATVTSSARCTSYNSTYWRVELTFLATAAAWSVAILPAAAAQGQSTGVESAAGVGSQVFYGAQVELGSFASSYIPTTTIAVARNADVLTYSSAGNVSGTVGWCYAEISADWDTPPPSNYCAMGFGTSIEGLITGSVAGLPTEIRAFDGTNSAQQAGNPTMYRTPRNTAVTWGGSSMSVGQSGVVTAGSFDGNIGTTAIGVGNSGAGAFQWFGTIRDVRIGQRQLSASEMQAITA